MLKKVKSWFNPVPVTYKALNIVVMFMVCAMATVLSVGNAFAQNVESGLNTALGSVDLTSSIASVSTITAALITITLVFFAYKILKKLLGKGA